MKINRNFFIKNLFLQLFLLFILNSCSHLTPLSLNIPHGGRALSISVDPTNDQNIVVASARGGLFLSTNRGNKWFQVSDKSTYAFTDVIYVPSDPHILVATANSDSRIKDGGCFWRSTNGGNDWSRPIINAPPSINLNYLSALCISFASEINRLWAGTSIGIAYSDDLGATWEFLSQLSNECIYAILSPSLNHIIILSSSGLKVSNDNGITWSHSKNGLPENTWVGYYGHNQIAVSPLNENHIYWTFNSKSNNDIHNTIYLSTDNGINWFSIYDVKGVNNRNPFIKISNSPLQSFGIYKLYYGNGFCTLQETDVIDSAMPVLYKWTKLYSDHCDVTDIGFSNDKITPILLASDGGLHKTNDYGLNWTLIGNNAGYNALQVNEVIGQLHAHRNGADYYFATHDNNIWSSNDNGASWLEAPIAKEGNSLNISRDYFPSSEIRLTGKMCAPCINFISEPLFSNLIQSPLPFGDSGNSTFLTDSKYIHNVPSPTATTYQLSDDYGISWTPRFAINESSISELPKLSGDKNNPVVFLDVKRPGVSNTGGQIIGIKKITDILGNGLPITSDINGFGNLGTFCTEEKFYIPFGVNPFNPNHIIVADIIDKVVKSTVDGGITWSADNTFTQLITENGTFDFVNQVSSFGFDPDCKGHILIGTQQNGIFRTPNNGYSWEKLRGSDAIPYVSGFFFNGNNEVIISSDGRGLWKFDYKCVIKKFVGSDKVYPIRYEHPWIYFHKINISLKDINISGACTSCAFYLIENGQIIDFSLDSITGEISEVSIDKGSIKRYSTSYGGEIKIPFKINYADKIIKLNNDQDLLKLLKDSIQVKGLYLEGRIFKGFVLSLNDVGKNELPIYKHFNPYIRILNYEVSKIIITGTGFDYNFPLEFLLDGKKIALNNTPEYDDKGIFIISIPIFDFNKHTLIVQQLNKEELIKDAVSFCMPHQDNR